MKLPAHEAAMRAPGCLTSNACHNVSVSPFPCLACCEISVNQTVGDEGRVLGGDGVTVIHFTALAPLTGQTVDYPCSCLKMCLISFHLLFAGSRLGLSQTASIHFLSLVLIHHQYHSTNFSMD